MLAFGQIRAAIVVTDDLGMHQLAKDFEIAVWHGHELLKKMLTAKAINEHLVREIFEALEANGDIAAMLHLSEFLAHQPSPESRQIAPPHLQTIKTFV